MDFGQLIAYIVFLISIIMIYFGFLEFSLELYRKNHFWLIAFIIFIAPFLYILPQAGSLLNLMWMLLFTPLYGVATLMLVFTRWMLLYYASAYGILAVNYVFFKKLRSSAP